MKHLLPTLLGFGLALVLASCGQQAPMATPTTSETLTSTLPPSTQALASTTTLNVGQSVQFKVYVGAQPAQPGQLRWTTSNAGVASVTQTGLVTAVGAGSATVRTTLVSNPSAYIDFPIVVSAPATTPPPPSGTPSGTFAQRVFDLTNAARAQARTCGTTSYAATTPLTYNALLAQAAQAHASDMATKNYFSHTSLDGRTPDQRVSATGYTWTRMAENIATGNTTPEEVVAGWLQSPGHCANIMSPNLKELGVGYAYNAGSSYGHYWVQDFGTR